MQMLLMCVYIHVLVVGRGVNFPLHCWASCPSLLRSWPRWHPSTALMWTVCPCMSSTLTSLSFLPPSSSSMDSTSKWTGGKWGGSLLFFHCTFTGVLTLQLV